MNASRIFFTKEGYQKVLDQKARWLAERPLAVENLKKSRELGDLSENGYYKASRARLSFIDAQLRKLERLVRLGKVVEQSNNYLVGFGSRVKIKSNSFQKEYTIVGGYESDPSTNTISHVSPLGKALMGHKVGDIVALHAPNGDMEYEILSISSS